MEHVCLTAFCEERAEKIGVRGNLLVYRCKAGHEFACNPRYCLRHDHEEVAYMQRRNQARLEGWCMRDHLTNCDCVLCKTLH